MSNLKSSRSLVLTLLTLQMKYHVKLRKGNGSETTLGSFGRLEDAKTFSSHMPESFIQEGEIV